MLIPQSLDTQWYERAAECANETVILSGGRVAFVEPDVELGLVEVNINPGGSMLLIFRGYCQEAGHTISKIPLAVMKSWVVMILPMLSGRRDHVKRQRKHQSGS
jgi:hypothetical protein